MHVVHLVFVDFIRVPKKMWRRVKACSASQSSHSPFSSADAVNFSLSVDIVQTNGFSLQSSIPPWACSTSFLPICTDSTACVRLWPAAGSSGQLASGGTGGAALRTVDCGNVNVRKEVRCCVLYCPQWFANVGSFVRLKCDLGSGSLLFCSCEFMLSLFRGVNDQPGWCKG